MALPEIEIDAMLVAHVIAGGAAVLYPRPEFVTVIAVTPPFVTAQEPANPIPVQPAIPVHTATASTP